MSGQGAGICCSLCELVLNLVTQFLARLQRPACDARSFDMTPHQLIGIQVGRIARQEMQGQHAVGGWPRTRAPCTFLCAGRLSSTRCSGFRRYFIICCSRLDKQLGVERTFVGAEPERALGIDRRSRAEGLPLPGPQHHRRLTPDAPGLAVDGVGPETRLIPEEDVGTLGPGLPGDAPDRFPAATARWPPDRAGRPVATASAASARSFASSSPTALTPRRTPNFLLDQVAPPPRASTTRSPNRTGAGRGH